MCTESGIFQSSLYSKHPSMDEFVLRGSGLEPEQLTQTRRVRSSGNSQVGVVPCVQCQAPANSFSWVRLVRGRCQWTTVPGPVGEACRPRRRSWGA